MRLARILTQHESLRQHPQIRGLLLRALLVYLFQRMPGIGSEFLRTPRAPLFPR